MAAYRERDNFAADYRYEQFESQYEAREAELRRETERINMRRAELKRNLQQSLRTFCVITAAAVVCAVCVVLVHIKTEINGVQKEINEMNTQISQLQRENNVLLADINASGNIYVIMEKAEALGMGYPDDAHVLEIGRP